MSLFSRIANVFRNEHLNREIAEEYASHLEEAVLAGRDPAEAKRALGNTLRRQEESHAIHVVAWLDALRADFVFGWRRLNKNRVTSLAAFLSLALSIGACTSAFRLIDALLWRPLPVTHPERIYVLSRQGMGFDNRPGEWDSWAYPDFQLMSAAVKGQADLIAVSYTDHADITYKTDQETEKAFVQHVSGNMFPTFGIQAARGRLFSPEEDRFAHAAPYAVLSYDYWTRRFGRDPNVIGHTVRYGDELFEIVGISEKKFTGTEPGVIVDIFLPARMHPRAARVDSTWLRTLAIVSPGVPLGPLRAHLEAIDHAFESNRLRGETGLAPETLRGVLSNRLRMEPAPTGVSSMRSEYSRALAAIAILVVLVLLIACANVANLMTAQSATRSREMALRVSIGAGRARLVRLVLAEGMLLALFSSLGGAFFSWWSAPLVVAMLNRNDTVARLILPADARVLCFGMAMIVCVVGLLGIVPAVRASFVKPVSALKGEDARARPTAMHAMIAVQVAFCFLVLFVAGLFVTTLEHLTNIPLGFSPQRLLLLETVSRAGAPSAYWDQVERHLREMPGVERVAQADWPLLKGYSWNDSISLNGGPPSVDLAYFLSVSPGFLETMRIPMLGGRDFQASDSYPQAAIVNQAFARKFLESGNPVGQVFDKSSDAGSKQRMQVVAVMADAYYNVIRNVLPVVFVPIHRTDNQLIHEGTFVVRTTAENPLVMSTQLRQEVGKIRPELRVSNVRTQQQLVDAQNIRPRMLATLAAFFALVAILLAGVGLYGVLFYSVVERHREIGIRIALGARALKIVGPILSGISLALATGMIIGFALGSATAHYLESLLYHVRPSDALQLVAPAGVILVAAVLAAAPAVSRALHINPVDLLRSE